MKFTSSAFHDRELIPQRFTCDGESISPPLEWSDIPEQTQSLALIVDDPDAPDGTFVHWLIWNIPPGTSGTLEGHRPAGAIEGTNSNNNTAYYPACPPSGTHRYIFKLYALDTVLNLPHTARKDDLEEAIQGHIITESQLIGLYHRVEK